MSQSASSNWAEKAKDEEVSSLVGKLSIQKENGEESKPNDAKEPEAAQPATATATEETPDVANPAETSLLMKIIRKGLVESKLDLEIQRKDPSSPLYSVKTFEALHLKPELLKGVYAMGFNAPSKIQETALPTLLADPPQNMIAQSQSGTGKTAAFVLAMLSRVDTAKEYPQVLCLSPTYELAIQTGEVAAKMGRFCPEIKK